MAMTDLCDPNGDSATAGRRISEPYIRIPNLILIRFSVKRTNGFIIDYLTDLLTMQTGHFYGKHHKIFVRLNN